MRVKVERIHSRPRGVTRQKFGASLKFFNHLFCLCSRLRLFLRPLFDNMLRIAYNTDSQIVRTVLCCHTYCSCVQWCVHAHTSSSYKWLLLQVSFLYVCAVLTMAFLTVKFLHVCFFAYFFLVVESLVVCTSASATWKDTSPKRLTVGWEECQILLNYSCTV